MNAAKNIALLVLAAAAIGLGLLVGRQHLELLELRAATMNRDERADYQKRIWELEKQNRELQTLLAAAQPASTRDPGAIVEAAADCAAPTRGPGGRGGRGGSPQQIAAIRELMSKPEVQAMLGLQQRAAIDARYAALFKNLNLTPDQQAKLAGLLAEGRTTRRDVEDAARAQGIDPRSNPEAYQKLLADAQADIDASIKAVIGEAGYAQLQNYEKTLPQRSVVNELQQRLSVTDVPLTSAQIEQMVQVLATTSTTSSGASDSSFGPPGGRGGGDLGGMLMGALGGGPDAGRGGATISDAAIAQAQTTLSATQVAALRQIQQQQQAQQQLQQMVRDTISSSQTQGGTTSSSGGSTSRRPRG